jgi:uncharacterized membrane protein
VNRWMSGYRLASVLLVLGNFLLVAALYSWLPDPYPTRMDSSGLAVGLTRKPVGPFVTPLLTAAALLGMFVFPGISPKKFRVDKFLRVFDVVYFVSIAASVSVSVIGVLEVIGIRVPAGLSRLPTSLSLLVFGNFMSKTTKNFWLGIRTPWTLASDEVWLKTHRLAGAMFMIAGLVDLAMAVAGWNVTLSIIATLLAVVAAIVASYVFYRRLEHPGRPSGPTTSDTAR